MTTLLKMIHEQFLDYTNQLKQVEKEIIRKYKAGEDYSNDVTKAVGLKMMQKEALKMMMQKNTLI